jgi:hypothetical protein
MHVLAPQFQTRNFWPVKVSVSKIYSTKILTAKLPGFKNFMPKIFPAENFQTKKNRPYNFYQGLGAEGTGHTTTWTCDRSPTVQYGKPVRFSGFCHDRSEIFRHENFCVGKFSVWNFSRAKCPGRFRFSAQGTNRSCAQSRTRAPSIFAPRDPVHRFQERTRTLLHVRTVPAISCQVHRVASLTFLFGARPVAGLYTDPCTVHHERNWMLKYLFHIRWQIYVVQKKNKMMIKCTI